MLTALFFLNDDFEGGRTRILEHDRAVDVVPEKGSVLFFHHPLLHEGEGVELGVKYILRSDVMYRITRRIRGR